MPCFNAVCNSAHQDIPNNITDQFIAQNTIRQTVGVDGNHNKKTPSGIIRVKKDEQPDEGRFVEFATYKEVKNKGVIESLQRKPKGFMLYAGENEPVSIGYQFDSVYKLLEELGK